MMYSRRRCSSALRRGLPALQQLTMTTLAMLCLSLLLALCLPLMPALVEGAMPLPRDPWPAVDPAAPSSLEASVPLSPPSVPGAQDQLPQSKFTRSEAMAIEDVVFGSDPSGFQRLNKCPLDIQLVWSNSLNTGVYASSVIAHLYPDPTAGAQVIIPGFHRELNVLDRDGHHVPGSPISMSTETYFHSAPLLLDWNRDGIKDVVWVNVDAEVYVINGDPHAEAAVLDYPFQIPKLKVKKRWYEGLEKAAAKAAAEKKNPSAADAGDAAGAGGRKLLSVEEDPLSPRAIMRREKQKMYLLRRVTRKLKQTIPLSSSSSSAAPSSGPGRKLLQAKGGGGGKGKLGSRHRSRVAAKAAAAKQQQQQAAAAAAPPKPEVVQSEQDDDQEQQEQEQAPNVDEPAPANTPLAVSPKVDASNADLHLESLASKYAPGHGRDEPPDLSTLHAVDAEEEAFLASLVMPEAPRATDEDEEAGSSNVAAAQLVDDQEADDPVGEGMPGAGAGAGARTGLEGGIAAARRYIDEYETHEEEQTGDAASDVPARRGGAARADAQEEEVDDRQLSDFSPQQIQAALDELLKEDPSFMDGLSEHLELPPEAAPKPTEDGSLDYAASIRALAEKFGRQEEEIARRQHSRNQRTDAEDAEALAREGEASLPRTGIESKDSQLREAYRRKQVPQGINSNVVRILGETDKDGEKGSGARSGAGASDPLEDLLTDQALLDSQLTDGLPDEARESLNLFADLPDTRSKLRELDPEIAWELAELDRLYPVLPDDIWVDAHVLSTPVLADLNGDDQPELIVSVSYFFDETDYANNPSLLKRLGSDVDLKKYVAGGLVVIDLWSHKVIWSEHLDQSTDDPHLEPGSKAFVYASPTVVDLDGDGGVEIILPTSMGFVYGFSGLTHRLLPGFPLATRMGEIQAGVAVEDLNADGFLEMVVMDAKGNVLCFDSEGNEVWSTLISGFASAAASFGDVDGNGVLDVVVGTVSGHVWVLDGATGKSVPNFPLRTDGRIVAPITLVNMARPALPLLGVGGSSSAYFARPGLHLIFPSFDGHVYLVDGRTGCTNKLDIGEHAYGQVLAADILGRGKIDLLVTTMAGNVFCFGTEVDLADHPLRAWPSQHHGLNGFTAREGYQGVYFTRSTKELHAEVSGREFEVQYVVVDERAKQVLASMSTLQGGNEKSNPADQRKRAPARYEIEFHFGGERVGSTVHNAPGVYSFTIAAGRIPQYTTLEIRMTNEHAQLFQDEFVIGMNVHFYRVIKYVVVIPFLAMIGVLLLVKKLQPALPV